MNPRQLVALLLALLAFWHGTAAVAQTPETIWGQVPTIGQLQRRMNTSSLPPLTPAEIDAFRREAANSVRRMPTDTFWSAIKSGGTRIVKNPMSVVKAGGRFVAYSGALSIGVSGFNYLMQKAFSSLQQQSGGTLNTLEQCQLYAANTGHIQNLDMPCDMKGNSYTYIWPDFEWKAGNYCLFNFKDAMGYNYYFCMDVTQIQGYPAGTYIATATYSCGLSLSGSYGQYGETNIRDRYTYYKNNCARPNRVTSDPINLTDFVEGKQTTTYTVPPHPEVKEQLKEAVAREIERTPMSPAPGSSVYPGITLDPMPAENQYYGGCVNVYTDLDADGWSDCEEILRQSDPQDRASIPDLTRDTDGDGVPDGTEDRYNTDPYDPASKPTPAQLLDTDGDGLIDTDDPDDDNDGVPDTKDPAPLDKTIPVKCQPGFEPNATGLSCVPAKDESKCPEGQMLDASEPPKCVPDTRPKDPVGDECGDLSLKRAAAHLGHYLRDVVFPCDDQDYTRLVAMIQGKFPFSLLGSLGTFFQSTSGGAAASPLPNKIGPFTVDTSWAAGLLLLIKTGWRAFLWWSFFTWITHRLSGQVVLS